MLKLMPLLFLIASVASAAEMSPADKVCLLRNPVMLGASITAETPRTIPGYSQFVSALLVGKLRFGGADFGVSPSRLLYTKYANHTDDEYAALKNLAARDTSTDADYGHSQIARLLNEDRASFHAASVVVGLDVFYWDAADGHCSYDNTQPGTEQVIDTLIDQAREQGTKLILGNVPEEDPSQVLINGLGFNGYVFWYPQDMSCVRSINAELKNKCTLENGCYIVDFKKMVDTLDYQHGRLALRDGSSIDIYETRPDGVHLSNKGSQYVYEQILDGLEAQPFQCARPPL